MTCVGHRSNQREVTLSSFKTCERFPIEEGVYQSGKLTTSPNIPYGSVVELSKSISCSGSGPVQVSRGLGSMQLAGAPSSSRAPGSSSAACANS